MTTIYFQTEEISKFDLDYYKSNKKVKLLKYNVEFSKNKSKNYMTEKKKDKLITKLSKTDKHLCIKCNCYIKNFKIHKQSKKHKKNSEFMM